MGAMDHPPLRVFIADDSPPVAEMLTELIRDPGQVDVIELSESVIAAAPFFGVANMDVLARPNVHISIDDGRNFLLRNRQAYDVVTADVVHPYDAGATNLYSVEYFELVTRSLKPDGIMVQ